MIYFNIDLKVATEFLTRFTVTVDFKHTNHINRFFINGWIITLQTRHTKNTNHPSLITLHEQQWMSVPRQDDAQRVNCLQFCTVQQFRTLPFTLSTYKSYLLPPARKTLCGQSCGFGGVKPGETKHPHKRQTGTSSH